MFNVTKIICDRPQPMDALRYGHGSDAPASASARRPVVVWNVTRTCNLRCTHCYSDSEPSKYAGELTFDEGRVLLDDLAGYGVPAVLFSGGEPLARHDTLELAQYARALGLKVTLSTNGTLIDRDKAERIKNLGITYVGISFDGIGATNDRFRGVAGAFERALRAIRHLKAVGQKVGLRLTLTPNTVADLEQIFDFIEAEDIERACFYHLVPAGRGSALVSLSHQATRAALDTIFARTQRFAAAGRPREILTVDNHADAAYAVMWLEREGIEHATAARAALEWNGGANNSSGTGIADIDWLGNVHPDQFLQSITLGNIREQPFSAIWGNGEDPLLSKLRNRRAHVEGRCRSCRFFSTCGGNFRARAYALTGNLWAEDPACYLTDDEIAMTA